MTMWLLAILLVASVAALGFRQGAIRVGFSFVGILFGALLAPPLGRVLAPVLGVMGLKNPVLLWLVAPFIVFVVISVLFKVAALTVHQKVDVFYKYKAGDLRLAMWERVNHRLGLCLGVLNGFAYLILISWVIYTLSYWTYQVASSDSDPTSIRLMNRIGSDLHSSGLAKAAAAVDGVNPAFYDAADVAGLMYNNSLLEARLSRYPGGLALTERPEFQELGNDKDFRELRQRREAVMNMLHQPRAQAIVDNPDLLRTVWTTLKPDLKDLRAYLETGKSAKYDGEKILGRWLFDLNATGVLIRRARPTLTSSEMQKLKKALLLAFAKTTLVAMNDHQVIIKDIPKGMTGAAAAEHQTVQGEWKNTDGKYELTLNGKGTVPAVLEADRLTVSVDGVEVALARED